MRRLAVLAYLAAALAAPLLRAETASYTIAVPSDAAAAFEVPIQAVHAGRVLVHASWAGGRLLSFRLVREPDGATIARRSGPSPQRIEIEVAADQLRPGGVNVTLEIRALSGRDRADGTVEVTVPDPPEVVAAREEAERPPPPPSPTAAPWAVAAAPPQGAPPRLAQLFASVERLRAAVFGADPFSVHDACGWQDDLVRWLSQRRDGLVEGAAPASPATLRYLRRLAAAVRSVDGLRTSDNPLIAGPIPETSLRRRAWLLARSDEIRPIERELDRLASALRSGEVAEFQDERWLSRLLACITSSERYFEARGRSSPGTIEGAELAEAQWPRIVAAADALDALSAWLEAPSTP